MTGALGFRKGEGWMECPFLMRGKTCIHNICSFSSVDLWERREKGVLEVGDAVSIRSILVSLRAWLMGRNGKCSKTNAATVCRLTALASVIVIVSFFLNENENECGRHKRRKRRKIL
eukprot:scaffold1060_cov196-Amphora_coffeaeformis.AAC.27